MPLTHEPRRSRGPKTSTLILGRSCTWMRSIFGVRAGTAALARLVSSSYLSVSTGGAGASKTAAALRDPFVSRRPLPPARFRHRLAQAVSSHRHSKTLARVWKGRGVQDTLGSWGGCATPLLPSSDESHLQSRESGASRTRSTVPHAGPRVVCFQMKVRGKIACDVAATSAIKRPPTSSPSPATTAGCSGTPPRCCPHAPAHPTSAAASRESKPSRPGQWHPGK
jgi:hypothetical protein